ncbi:hypothetical protein ACFLRF_04380 [Candidatus Altiarchaeota archaeon]
MKQDLQTIVPACFFAILLLTGFSVYDDYGMGVDELYNRDKGVAGYEYYVRRAEYDFDCAFRKYYPVGIELPLVVIERAIGVTDSRDIFLMRHLLVFLLHFTSLVFFFLLCRKLLTDWRLALAGTVFLALTPRIFAQAFYNSKDLSFMSMFIIATYTLLMFREGFDMKWAVAHAIATGLLIDTRIMGVLVLAWTGLTLIMHAARQGIAGLIKPFITYSLILAIIVLVFWPFLWSDPLSNFIEGFSYYSSHKWGISNMFNGQIIRNDIPLSYVPVWMLLTIPSFIIILFILGLPSLLQARSFDRLMVLSWAFTAPLTVMLLGSSLNYGWRHLYFIYPAMIVTGLYGLKSLEKVASRILKGRSKAFMSAVTLLILFNLSLTTWSIISDHPYQMAYFNIPAHLLVADLPDKFELDYWGMSVADGLRWALEDTDKPAIKVRIVTRRNFNQVDLKILAPDERSRIRFKGSKLDYFITMSHKPHSYKDQKPAYEIRSGGLTILKVYRIG